MKCAATRDYVQYIPAFQLYPLSLTPQPFTNFLNNHLRQLVRLSVFLLAIPLSSYLTTTKKSDRRAFEALSHTPYLWITTLSHNKRGIFGLMILEV